MKLDKLIQALDLLVEQTDSLDQNNEELADILPEYLEEIYRVANLGEIESRISESRSFEKKDFENILEIIQKGNLKKYEYIFQDGNREIDPNALIKEIQEDINTLSENSKKWNPLEILIRVELSLDREFSDLLVAIDVNSPTFNKISKILEQKLFHLSGDDVLLLWGRLLNLFKSDDFYKGLKIYDDILPKDFLKTSDSHREIIEKIAIFIAKYKPLTIKKMVSEGFTTFPAGFPGVARILSISNKGKILKVTNMDILMVRLTSQVIAIWERVLFKNKKDLAKSISVSDEGLIFSGHYFSEFKKRLENNSVKINLRTIVQMLKRLRKYAEEHNSSESDVSSVLWRYKLGQEIIAPKYTDDILNGKLNEIALQKHLSKYLIDRGILSFGRVFGRSEVDLYTEHFGENFVIETKIYKQTPTVTKVLASITQIKSYMDQIRQARGILAIYNCSDTLLVAPKKWLLGRVWVLVINIGHAPPSKRDHSIELIEEQSGKIFLYQHGKTTKRKKRSKK